MSAARLSTAARPYRRPVSPARDRSRRFLYGRTRAVDVRSRVVRDHMTRLREPLET